MVRADGQSNASAADGETSFVEIIEISLKGFLIIGIYSIQGRRRANHKTALLTRSMSVCRRLNGYILIDAPWYGGDAGRRFNSTQTKKKDHWRRGELNESSIDNTMPCCVDNSGGSRTVCGQEGPRMRLGDCSRGWCSLREEWPPSHRSAPSAGMWLDLCPWLGRRFTGPPPTRPGCCLSKRDSTRPVLLGTDKSRERKGV